ncbi:MAG: hypothetical protein LAN61_12710 [Acidobacteriia bacterium]|nr:hypothetical protein [Terriglobia bacterium]
MAKDPQFVVKKRGEKLPAVLGDEVSEQLLDELDELEAHLDFVAAQASGETPLPFDEATARIKRSRK